MDTSSGKVKGAAQGRCEVDAGKRSKRSTRGLCTVLPCTACLRTRFAQAHCGLDSLICRVREMRGGGGGGGGPGAGGLGQLDAGVGQGGGHAAGRVDRVAEDGVLWRPQPDHPCRAKVLAWSWVQDSDKEARRGLGARASERWVAKEGFMKGDASPARQYRQRGGPS